jgi:hypothetical protein
MKQAETPSISSVSQALLSVRFNIKNEMDLHAGIAEALDLARVEYQREVRIGPTSRIDFLCGRIGIEVKIKGTPADVRRQMTRYAASDRIDSLVLITTKHIHCCLPEQINGKTVETIWLGFQGAF